MRDAQTITEVAVSTTSTEPFRGTVEIVTASSTIKFELNEDLAHQLSTQLDRFLTQRRPLREKLARSR